MKKLSLFILLSLGSLGSMAFAEEFNAVCEIRYVSANESVKLNSRENIGLDRFSAKRVKLGSLTLEVFVGGNVQVALDQNYPMLSAMIYDDNYPAPQSGEIAVVPGSPAKASYKTDGTSESMSAVCSILKI